MFGFRKAPTILDFHIAGEREALIKKLDQAEAAVRKAVDGMADKCSPTARFCDPDFGPTSNDATGAWSLYRSGSPPRPTLPAPNTVQWLRPNVRGCAPNASGFFCDDACLFKEGHSSSDVVQGKLGDCWLIGSIAVVANEFGYLESVFYNGKREGDHFVGHMNPRWANAGIWVVRFIHEATYRYVIIDDRLPCDPRFKSKLLFARCTDISELWVPLIEKAYAKLVGSYDSLIGGFVEIGIRDLTGLCPENISLTSTNDKNIAAYYQGELLYKHIQKRLNSGCLMGCAIIPSGSSVVEEKGPLGLIYRHAYSLLGAFEVKTSSGPVRLLVIKNPWGKGEWEGEWSDKSAKKQQNLEELKRSWRAQAKRSNTNILLDRVSRSEVENLDIFSDKDDGIFLMSFEDFSRHYNQVFSCMNFPASWRGRRILGEWTTENSGGNSSLQTWRRNPAYKLHIPKDGTQILIQMSQAEKRSKFGMSYMSKLFPIAFRIVPGDYDFTKERHYPPQTIPNTVGTYYQPVFSVAESVSLECVINKGDYYLVPCSFEVGQLDKFIVSVYTSDESFTLECSEVIGEEEEGPTVPKPVPKYTAPQRIAVALPEVADPAPPRAAAPSHPEPQPPSYVPGRVGMMFDPEKYDQACAHLKSLLVKHRQSVSAVVKRYASLPMAEQRQPMTIAQFRGELVANCGLLPSELPDDLIRVLAGSDGVLTQSDIVDILREEEVSKPAYDDGGSDDFNLMDSCCLIA